MTIEEMEIDEIQIGMDKTFEILDKVGLVTAYNIVEMYVKIPSFLAPYNFKGISKMLKVYIDKGKTGKSSGEGFYKYCD